MCECQCCNAVITLSCSTVHLPDSLVSAIKVRLYFLFTNLFWGLNLRKYYQRMGVLSVSTAICLPRFPFVYRVAIVAS